LLILTTTKFENFQQKSNEENQLKEEIEKLRKNWKNENIEAEYEAELKMKENLKNEIEQLKMKLKSKEKQNNNHSDKNALLTVFRT